MIKICIIDNDYESVSSAKKAIDKYFSKYDVKYETDNMAFEALISPQMWAECGYDLAVLNLSDRLNRRELMEYSVEIRKTHRKTKVIFVSNDIGCVLDTFDYSPDYFIYIPQMADRLVNAMEHLLKLEASKVASGLVLSTKSAKHIIPQSSILYLEHYQHSTKIICKDKEVICHEKLSSLLERLDSRMFIRCHCSFIVNLEQTRKFTRTQLFMSNGDVLPCSRSNQKSVRDAFELASKGRA